MNKYSDDLHLKIFYFSINPKMLMKWMSLTLLSMRTVWHHQQSISLWKWTNQSAVSLWRILSLQADQLPVMLPLATITAKQPITGRYQGHVTWFVAAKSLQGYHVGWPSWWGPMLGSSPWTCQKYKLISEWSISLPETFCHPFLAFCTVHVNLPG